VGMSSLLSSLGLYIASPPPSPSECN
jgi:hypothetical protein